MIDTTFSGAALPVTISVSLLPQASKASFFGNGESVVKDAFKRFATEMGLEVRDEQPMKDTISEIAKVYRAAKEDLTKRANNGKQKVVKEDELENFLEQGWELVNTLHNEKVVIKNVSSL